MPRQKGDILYVLKARKPVSLEKAYEFIPAKEIKPPLPESFFRDAIAGNPELVIGPCQTLGLVDEDEEWRAWATEFHVKSDDGEGIGIIDVLLLSSAGRIGIVETKLASNSEMRREVLAQILDYATHLPRSLNGLSLQVPRDKDFTVEPEDVEQHLQDRDFLLIIAGDELEDRMIRLSESLLGKHMANPWDLALVDICPYRTRGTARASEVLLVPAIRKAVVAESRNVVRIDATGGVKIEHIAPSMPGRPQSITPDKFFATMAEECPAAVPKVKELIGKLDEDERLKQSGTTSSILYEFRNGRVLRINPEGTVVVNGKMLLGPRGKSIKNADEIVAELIKATIASGFKFKQERKDYRCSITSDECNMQGLLKGIKEFLDTAKDE